jgi:hypothetical protein
MKCNNYHSSYAFFNDKPIFLVDKKLNKIHNISEGSYQFDSEA